MPLDLRPDYLAMVQTILRRHVPDREVWAFGSRVTGAAGPTSDLDLCVIGQTPLSLETAAHLRMDFSESDLPYLVDLVDWTRTSPAFRRIIEADKLVVQEPPPASGAGTVRLDDRHPQGSAVR
jgi:type I restriction enzyme S subunit